MKGQNRKLVISLFISIIAICYVSLAISYAWFFANRAQDNSANNLKIVDFNGDIFYYKDPCKALNKSLHRHNYQ